MKLTNKWTNRRSWQDTVPGARWTYIILALKVALNSALSSASCLTALTETTFAPKPKVALRVYCVAVRSAILATAWLLVLFIITHHRNTQSNQLTVMWRHLLNYFETKSNSVLFLMQNGSRGYVQRIILGTFASFTVQSILLCRGTLVTLVPDMAAVSLMVKHCPFCAQPVA